MDISFDTIAKAWRLLTTDGDRVQELQKMVPFLNRPSMIRLKKIGENDRFTKMQFYNFVQAVDKSSDIPYVKNMIVTWLKKISSDVQLVIGSDEELTVIISHETKFDEAAVPIYKRDPKTNTIKRAYRCIGGAKDGRRVSSPDQCLVAPDVEKRAKFAISKREKAGAASVKRKKTKITNIVSRKLRKANQRLKKARGF